MSQRLVYSFGRYQMRINIWLLIVFLLLQALLNELGFWQLERAQQKQQRIALMAEGEKTRVNQLTKLTAEKIERFQSVEVKLRADNSKIFLLDNKIDNKRLGYHVFSIAEDVASGKKVLVNRGWIYADHDRSKLPEVELITEDWLVEARVYPLPKESISTASASIENFGRYYRLPVMDLKIKKAIEQQTHLQLEDYILRVNSGSQGAFKTNWIWTNMPAEKHLAYAFQWFALALALLIISVIASLKKR